MAVSADPRLVLLVLAAGCSDLNHVVINEFVAKNAAGLEDNGTHPDWIELYNRGGKTVDLSGWFMTDDRADPLKWKIPNGVEIEGKGYLVIIADDDPEEGKLHAEFQLSDDGEDLGLYGPEDKDYEEVDLILDFPPMAADTARIRKPDGEDDSWKDSSTPTPGKPNK